MTTLLTELFEILPEFEELGREHKDGQIETLLRRALENPINHPMLAESIFPGDRIAIVVQNGLPAARKMLDALLRSLQRFRIETADVLVVVPEAMKRVFDLVEVTPADQKSGAAAIWRMAGDDDPDALRFEIHATDQQNAATYLAANEQGNPIYVNRSLCDSEVILPLSCLAPAADRPDCLYPEYSIDETRVRFREEKDTLAQRVAEAQLANDSLGLFFSIEMICRPGDVVEDIICGSRVDTRRVASERLNSLWDLDLKDDYDAVVTTIESTGEKATWTDLVSAVRVAANGASDGPILVLSQIKEKPSGKVQAACSAQFEGSVPESLPEHLQHFASILCERPVYLSSALAQDYVEGLGLGYLESTESARRILKPCSEPLLIRDAHLRIDI